MDKDTLNRLIEKVNNGTATAEEKLAVLKEINDFVPKLNVLLGNLSEALRKEKAEPAS